MRFASRWCAANITASQIDPSLHSASLIRTKIRREQPSRRAANAAPVPIAKPVPQRAGREINAGEGVFGVNTEAVVACCRVVE